MKMRINDTKTYDVTDFISEYYDMEKEDINFDVEIEINDLQNDLEYLTNCKYSWLVFDSMNPAKETCPTKEKYINCKLISISRRERRQNDKEVLCLYFKCPFAGNI